MIFRGSCIVVLIPFFFPSQVLGDGIDQTPLVATCSPATTAQVFSSLVYIDLISVHDPEFVFKTFPSDFVADMIQELGILKEYGLPDWPEISSRVASAISLVDTFTLSRNYLNNGAAVGEYLVGLGLLDCSNVIEWATKYFGFEQSRFKTMDPTRINSYVEAITRSAGDLLHSLGYSLEEKDENFHTLADLFYKEYSKYAS